MDQDTIIALSTPPGPAALALVRLSGPQAHEVVTARTGATLQPGKAQYCRIREENEIIDDVVVTTWKKPASYTGEDMAEISCHGNMLIVDRLIQLFVGDGCRQARPGEFTERAFLNDKMDLTQAEAVMDLIHARSKRALRAARKMHLGAFSTKIREMQDNLLKLLAHLEAYIDFPEEDIEPDVGSAFTDGVQALLSEVEALLQTADQGRLLRDGLKVVLAGAPNSGKSSLLNALVHRDRAIVSAAPGTTRDTIEETIVLEGILIRLIDTAGIREKPDEIEKLGISRSLEALKEADLILNLVDASDVDAALIPLPLEAEDTPCIVCLTKSDLPRHCKISSGIPISARTQAGLPELHTQISKTLSLDINRDDQDQAAINTRHETLLQRSAQALRRALDSSLENTPPELISSDIRDALNAWGEIVGQTTTEDMLDYLFSTFCIGK